ncbi:hypothetical protein BCAL_2269 [Bifidobacterium callitrichos DSM 23973]|uniref:Uncharacterized protein n=2 Tax=Bifidobacterium callitrichos TaxID=762209 RepID=A0A087A5W6_9BIFI|nr:hypothetical protein BCAL_2269 [Bifidobacterium callitrichos DSM 23973]
MQRCAPELSIAWMLAMGVLMFALIVVIAALVAWPGRRHSGPRWASRLVGTNWTPFLVYGTGVWLAHGLASGVWFGSANIWGSSGVCVGVDHWFGLLVIGVRGVVG